MNMVTVNINGMEYNLKGNENEEYLHKVASYVDKQLKSIQQNNGKLSTSQAAVLTALNVADEKFKIEIDFTAQNNEMKNLNYEKKSQAAELQEIKAELENYKNENKELIESINNNSSHRFIKEQEELIAELREKLKSAEEKVEEQAEKLNNLSKENTDLKYQLKTSKHKVLDLQNKLIENAIDLAKTKKNMDTYKKENFTK